MTSVSKSAVWQSSFLFELINVYSYIVFFFCVYLYHDILAAAALADVLLQCLLVCYICWCTVSIWLLGAKVSWLGFLVVMCSAAVKEELQ